MMLRSCRIVGLIALSGLGGCADATANAPNTVQAMGDLLDAPFGIVLYVNPVNCQLNARDAQRLNDLDAHPKMAVHVVFISFASDDSTSIDQAQQDLGLTVSTSARGLPVWAGGEPFHGRVPIAVVIRGGVPVTYVTGEAMDRTIDVAFGALGL